MSHSLPQNITLQSKATDDQTTHLPQASRDEPHANKCNQDHTQTPNDTASLPVTAAAPRPSSPVKSESPTQSCPSASVSQPTTPQPTCGASSPITQQHPEPVTTPPLPSPPQPSQHETHTFALRVPPASDPYATSKGNNNGKRKRREFDCTGNTPAFGMTQYNGNVYARDQSSILGVAVHAKVHHGFFLADNIWTCYRRNYFQINAAFTLHGGSVLYNGQEPSCFVRDDKHILHPIEQFHIGICARLSNSNKPIQLVQHTVKRDKGPQHTPESKPVLPGGVLSMNSTHANPSIVTFERLQFKSATANNGKRRAAQQYYVIIMELYAKIQSSDKMIPVASAISQPLVVRGRSPSHYEPASATVGPSVRYQPSHSQYQYYQQQTPFTSAPLMVVNHHHNAPTYSSHAPPPPPSSAMYTPGYAPYTYPATYPPPSHAGGPFMPNNAPASSSSSPPPTTSQHTMSLPLQPQHHHISPRPLAPSPNTTGHSGRNALSPLPPSMQRSESAPSTYDHGGKADHTQHHSAHFRISSTPSHSYHAPTSHPSHAPDVPYSQPQFIPYYCTSPSPSLPPPPSLVYGPSPPSDSASPPSATRGSSSNWKQWHPRKHTKPKPIKAKKVQHGFKIDIQAEPVIKTEKDKDADVSSRA